MRTLKFLPRPRGGHLSSSYRCTLDGDFYSGRVSLHTGATCDEYGKDDLAKNHYQVLGVGRDATKKEIRTAFVTLSKRYHPDSNLRQRPESKDVDSRSFVAVCEAYQILSNPRRRARYDSELAVVETYRTQYEQRFYGGSSATSKHREPFKRDKYSAYSPGRGGATSDQFYNYDEDAVDWELYRRSIRKPNHSRVLFMLLALTFTVPVLFMLRVNHNYHKYYQPAAVLESQRNMAAYKAVRDRARNSSVQEQLDLLVERHKNREKDVNKCSPNR